jgi:hypothetical protein
MIATTVPTFPVLPSDDWAWEVLSPYRMGLLAQGYHSSRVTIPALTSLALIVVVKILPCIRVTLPWTPHERQLARVPLTPIMTMLPQFVPNGSPPTDHPQRITRAQRLDITPTLGASQHSALSTPIQ